ncbi:hydrolase [Vibrio sp. UCD-FRSSP16_10]|uniref:alpha/beta fold hydrolase n=1 Tax=unclassified Vibrio TaxID=2614977 RepID=UPI0007FFC4E7|nr:MULTISPECIES: alpha/beta hydrolase [unclassified Vibrio]OBT08559.1 hydrolase [Vibrio sp. UCD-FRSSP16_30]OBT18089.1 hydrolase [Vibrio sp. UCD-FRSSP16_10]
MFKHRTFQVRDFTLAALCHEPKTPSHIVIFVHGWLDNAASFQPLMNEMSVRLPSANLISIDLPGHGLSSHAEAGFYPFHDYLDSLHQVMLQIKSHSTCPIALVGHSMGALITSCYSAAFPENVDHLIQIEGYGPIWESEQNALTRLRKGLLSRQRISKKPPRYFASFEEMLNLRAARYNLSSDLLLALVERDAQHTPQGWQWRHDNRLKAQSLYRMSQEHANQVTQALPCSNLLILGESGFSDLKTNIPTKANILQVKGGHHCHLSAAKLVANSIITQISPS